MPVLIEYMSEINTRRFHRFKIQIRAVVWIYRFPQGFLASKAIYKQMAFRIINRTGITAGLMIPLNGRNTRMTGNMKFHQKGILNKYARQEGFGLMD